MNTMQSDVNKPGMIYFSTSPGSPLRQFFTDDWRDHYPTKCDLYEILTHIDRYEIETLDIINRRHVNQARVSLFILAKYRGSGTESKIYMDIVTGAPTVQQLIDSTFNDGKDADYRIILFDEHFSMGDDDSPPGDTAVISNMVRRNNRNSIPTYLIEVRGVSSGVRKEFLYSVCEEPDVTPDTKMSLTPEDMMETEFWQCYVRPVLDVGPPDPEEDISGNWSTGHELRWRIETTTAWTEKGLLLTVESDPDPPHPLIWIWEDQIEVLEEAFPGCKIQMYEKSDASTRITVQACEVPMSKVIHLTPDEKRHLADLACSCEGKFESIIEELLSEYERYCVPE